MTESIRLELNFANELGKNRKVTIRRPVADLTEAQIKPVMQTIADNDIFSDDGIDPYGNVKNARYVHTRVEDVFDAE